MPEHGGRLRQAARRYGIPLADWLDLSTGINPLGWPVPAPPPAAWTRLPEDQDGLEAAARTYYRTQQLLVVAGSQAAIQALPRLRGHARVSVLDPGYFEHAQAWRHAGHQVTPVTAERLDDAAPTSDVLLLIHPNNPTGARFPLDRLLAWQARLAARDGWLVVDEAFMDVTPETSLARFCPRPGLIVLRSLGKFFGLAGPGWDSCSRSRNCWNDSTPCSGPGRSAPRPAGWRRGPSRITPGSTAIVAAW